MDAESMKLHPASGVRSYVGSFTSSESATSRLGSISNKAKRFSLLRISLHLEIVARVESFAVLDLCYLFPDEVR